MPTRTWVCMVTLMLGACASAQETVHVTGRARVVNGVSEVPAGLFGVHATRLTPELVKQWGVESLRVIHHGPTGKPMVAGEGNAPAGIGMIVECFWDRYQPALVLTDRNWKQRLETLAKTYAQNARATGKTHHVEFWNEPFLNWAVRPGVNYDPVYYEAKDQEIGKPMTIRGWDKPLDYLVWSRELRLVEPASGKVPYLPNGDPPLPPKIRSGELKVGGMYNFRGKEYRLDEVWWGKDPSQPSWYSGKQNSLFYRWMLVPFARALKEANPDVQLVAGWGFGIHTDGWKAWEVLFKPTIDDSAVEIGGRKQLLLDGIGEHHYGGDTRGVAGSYEVAYAYALGAYGKKLKFYNTEAGGMLDPQRPDTGKSVFSGGGPEEWRGMFSYFVRDLTHMIDVCPDKAIARAAHSVDGNQGDQAGFIFLRDLRGRLMQTKYTAGSVWSVASLNGRSLVVVVFNDGLAAAKVDVKVDAPAGTKFTGAARHTVRIEDGKLKQVEEPVVVSGGQWAGQQTIDAKMPVKLVFALDKAPAQMQEVRENQYVAGEVLQSLSPGQVVNFRISVPEDALARCKGARLRIVHEGWDNDAMQVTLNERPLEVKVNGTWIHEQPIDPTTLRVVNRLVIHRRTGLETGKDCRVDAASIYTVETDKP